jgi:hypothetical protein
MLGSGGIYIGLEEGKDEGVASTYESTRRQNPEQHHHHHHPHRPENLKFHKTILGFIGTELKSVTLQRLQS